MKKKQIARSEQAPADTESVAYRTAQYCHVRKRLAENVVVAEADGGEFGAEPKLHRAGMDQEAQARPQLLRRQHEAGAIEPRQAQIHQYEVNRFGRDQLQRSFRSRGFPHGVTFIEQKSSKIEPYQRLIIQYQNNRGPNGHGSTARVSESVFLRFAPAVVKNRIADDFNNTIWHVRCTLAKPAYTCAIRAESRLLVMARDMISYADKSFLVIDDFPEFRRSLRTMVQQLGAEDIDMAANGDEALSYCKSRNYDVILSDYNLGEGKDGQQILEELIARKLLRRGTIFVMCTAENSTAMVMGALEYQPDAYITKPFNKVALQARLDKLMEKREALADIDQALDKGDTARAIELCDREITSKSRYALACLRTKAELLEQEERLDEAAEIYASLSAERPVPWAMLGLARVTLGKGEAEAARKQFEDVIRQLPTLTPAYDGLAKTWIGLGEPVKAQQVLVEAVRRSPKAVLRQAELGQVARKNGDIDTATRAFRSAVSLGRHSVHKRADNYLHLADCLIQTIGSNPVEDKRSTDEVLKTLHELDTDYKGDKQISMRSLLSQGSLAKKQNRLKDAENAAIGASKLLQELDSSLAPEVAMEVADKFQTLGKTDIAKNVLQTCAELYSDNAEVMAKFAEQQADSNVVKQTDQALALNGLGISEFEQKKYDPALVHFREAVKLAPRNISIVLNTAQTLIESYRQRPKPELLSECQRYLDQVRNMPPTDKRYKRFQGLLHLTQQMTQAHK